MNERAHPAVRRGTIWWTLQAMACSGLTVALVFLAFWKPSNQATVVAVVAIILGPLLAFMAIRQIRSLRYEYRYSNDDAEQVE